ncbi:uncharacterized protein C17orf78 homolog [Tiliqua scincoides]|uniref:uncharacterized protein C17orf78 homolog n=1 Tax=Tiliqua scincoides TaxID=71010 RepID=UPI003461AEFE
MFDAYKKANVDPHHFFLSEFEKYDCHVQHYSEIFPKKIKSVSIILKEKAKMQQQQTRNQTLAVLQCSAVQSLVQVNIIVSEVYRGKSKITYLLQNLKLITDQDKDCATKCCLVSGESERNFQNQTEVSLTGKVLLPGVSACAISSNQTEMFAGREQTTNKTNGIKPPCKSDQMKDRKKKSILIKTLIVCALMPVVLAIMVFMICEIPCPCSCPASRLQRNIQKRIADRKKKKEAMRLEASGTSTTVCHSLTKYNSVMVQEHLVPDTVH